MVTNLVKTPRIHRWRDVMQSEGICVWMCTVVSFLGALRMMAVLYATLT